MSIHFRVESGIDSHKSYLTRVSTSGHELVVERDMTEDSLDSVSALLIEFVPDGKNIDVDAELGKIIEANPLIRVHPKLLAYDKAVASITKRNQSRKVVKSFRIPLGLKCRHTYTSKDDGCNYFFGKKFLKHKDGTVWCHVELIGEKTDNFKVDYSEDDETIVNRSFFPSSISIGSNMDEDSIIGNSFFEKSKSPTKASPKSTVHRNIETRSVAAKKNITQEVPRSPNQALVPNKFAELVKPFQVGN